VSCINADIVVMALKKGKKRAAPASDEGAAEPTEKKARAENGEAVKDASAAPKKKLKKKPKKTVESEAPSQQSPTPVPAATEKPKIAVTEGKRVKKKKIKTQDSGEKDGLADKEGEEQPLKKKVREKSDVQKERRLKKKADKKKALKEEGGQEKAKTQQAAADGAEKNDAGGDNNALKVYVGGISFDTPEETIRDDFAVCGEIEELICLKDHAGKFKGQCFISFKTQKGVDAALEFDGDEYGGRLLKVRKANNKEDREQDPYFEKHRKDKGETSDKNLRKVFIGGIPWDTPEHTLREDFEECGAIESLAALKDDSGRFKGIAFITFTTTEGVEAALKYDGDDYGGRTLKVAMASARDSGKGGKGKEGGKDKGKGKGKDSKGKDSKGKGKGDGKSKGKSDGKSKDKGDWNDWTCPKCGMSVFGSKDACFKCNVRRDGSEGKGKGKDKGKGKGKGKDKGKGGSLTMIE